MNIVELFARIGLKTDEDKAKRFDAAMKSVKIGMIAATSAAAGTAFVIRKITSEAMQAAIAFKQFEVETGASAQELQKWQAVAEQTNQSAQSVTDAVEAIVVNQEKIKLGEGNISGYQLLGIDPRQDPFKILEDLREKTKGLSDGMKKNILSQIGVGVGLLQTLNLTRKQFDEMAKKAWIIDPKAIKTLNETKSALDLANRAVGYMKAQIAVGLSPQIKKITKDFQDWMKVHEKGIIEGFKKGFRYVEAFIKAIYNAAIMINNAISATIGWKNAMRGLIVVMLYLNRAFLFSPLGLFTAAIIALIIVLDDLYTYSQGGKSVFGALMKEFPGFEKTIKVIRDVLKLLHAFGKGDTQKIKDITKEWGAFGEVVQKIAEGLTTIRDLFNKEYDKEMIEYEKQWKEAKGKPVSETPILKFLKEKFSIGLQNFGDFFGINPYNPKNQLGIPSTQQSINQTNDIKININGSGDPKATGDAAAKSLQRSINAASAQLSRNQ